MQGHSAELLSETVCVGATDVPLPPDPDLKPTVSDDSVTASSHAHSEIIKTSRLQSLCQDLAVSMGYERYRLSLSVAHKMGLTSYGLQWLTYDIHNGSTAWIQANQDSCISDPVAHSLRQARTGAIAWDQNFFSNYGARARWEAQAMHGFASGLTCCVPVSGNSLVMMSVSRCSGLPSHKEYQKHLVKLIEFTQHVAQPASLRLSPGGHSLGDDSFCTLTPLEIQCLQWCIEGIKANAAMQTLGIGLAEFACVLEGICTKLGCDDIDKAADKAARLSLVSRSPMRVRDCDWLGLTKVPFGSRLKQRPQRASNSSV